MLDDPATIRTLAEVADVCYMMHDVVVNYPDESPGAWLLKYIPELQRVVSSWPFGDGRVALITKELAQAALAEYEAFKAQQVDAYEEWSNDDGD